ncbi:hypothetical protein BH10ACT11_BH10ACT11_18190 [soil metagenome]
MSQEELVVAFSEGRISRRELIRRLVAGGVTVGAAATYAHLLAPEASANPGGICEHYGDPSCGGRIQYVSTTYGKVKREEKIVVKVSSNKDGDHKVQLRVNTKLRGTAKVKLKKNKLTKVTVKVPAKKIKDLGEGANYVESKLSRRFGNQFHPVGLGSGKIVRN